MPPSPVSLGLHHVGIRSQDLDKSLAFYVGGLGMSVSLSFDWENGGRAVLLDMGNRNYLEISNDGAPEPVGRFTHIALEVADCEAAYRQALAAGARPKGGPPQRSNVIQAKPAPWELICVYVIGPDGEEIEFMQTVSGPFAVPDGNPGHGRPQ